jgi:hypothetical protein
MGAERFDFMNGFYFDARRYWAIIATRGAGWRNPSWKSPQGGLPKELLGIM